MIISLQSGFVSPFWQWLTFFGWYVQKHLLFKHTDTFSENVYQVQKLESLPVALNSGKVGPHLFFSTTCLYWLTEQPVMLHFLIDLASFKIERLNTVVSWRILWCFLSEQVHRFAPQVQESTGVPSNMCLYTNCPSTQAGTLMCLMSFWFMKDCWSCRWLVTVLWFPRAIKTCIPLDKHLYVSLHAGLHIRYRHIFFETRTILCLLKKGILFDMKTCIPSENEVFSSV